MRLLFDCQFEYSDRCSIENHRHISLINYKIDKRLGLLSSNMGFIRKICVYVEADTFKFGTQTSSGPQFLKNRIFVF